MKVNEPARKANVTETEFRAVCKVNCSDLQAFNMEPFTAPAEGCRQKLKTHLLRTQSPTVLRVCGAGQYIAMYATPTARTSLLISTLSVHSPAFFQKPLPSFSCVACG